MVTDDEAASEGGHVRFGSVAGIAAELPDVRFTPESGHYQRAFYEYTP
jgi:hypothetical protein